QQIALANGHIQLTGTATITDGDGDKASSSATIDLGGNIRFQDDGPSATIAIKEDFKAIIDETHGQDAGSGDIASLASAPAWTATYGSPLEVATSGPLVTSQGSSYGADGAGSISVGFVLAIAQGSNDSGL